ncbi:hypothetical protein CKA32_003154 [Geitlerinema sp. FC II]|nr:hypothetical protein CKA32_003154 [Geitlerinema sp. FC II]
MSNIFSIFFFDTAKKFFKPLPQKSFKVSDRRRSPVSKRDRL